MIELESLCAGYPGRAVLKDVSLSFPAGRVVILVGPNGSGKSTLLRTALGLQPKTGGRVLLDGIPIEALTARQTALKAAYLPQSRAVPNITARRMVLHGRFPHLSFPRRYRAEDYRAAERALAWAGAEDIADRPMQELSGGQRQKVYLAMALAQETEVIFLDEPTTFLDLGRQFEVLELIQALNVRGKTIVMVLHDLAQALGYSHQTALMDQGRLVLCAGPQMLYESGKIDEVFGVRAHRAGETWYFTPRHDGG